MKLGIIFSLFLLSCLFITSVARGDCNSCTYPVEYCPAGYSTVEETNGIQGPGWYFYEPYFYCITISGGDSTQATGIRRVCVKHNEQGGIATIRVLLSSTCRCSVAPFAVNIYGTSTTEVQDIIIENQTKGAAFVSVGPFTGTLDQYFGKIRSLTFSAFDDQNFAGIVTLSDLKIGQLGVEDVTTDKNSPVLAASAIQVVHIYQDLFGYVKATNPGGQLINFRVDGSWRGGFTVTQSAQSVEVHGDFTGPRTDVNSPYGFASITCPGSFDRLMVTGRVKIHAPETETGLPPTDLSSYIGGMKSLVVLEHRNADNSIAYNGSLEGWIYSNNISSSVPGDKFQVNGDMAADVKLNTGILVPTTFHNITGVMNVGHAPGTEAISNELLVFGDITGELVLLGDLSQNVDIRGQITGKVYVDGSLNSPLFKIDGGINSTGLLSIANALSANSTITMPAQGLKGQIVINASNTISNPDTNAWLGKVTVGSTVLEPNSTDANYIAPYYKVPSSMLGGGAVGVVPFRLYEADCEPMHMARNTSPATLSETSNYIPTLGFETNNDNSAIPVKIRFYGPIVLDDDYPGDFTGSVIEATTEVGPNVCGYNSDQWFGMTSTFRIRNPGTNPAAGVNARTIGLSRAGGNSNGSTPPTYPHIAPGKYRFRYPIAANPAFVPSRPSAPYWRVCTNDLASDAFFFRVNASSSGGGGAPCIADFNGSGMASVQDIFDFLFAWFTGADCLLPTLDNEFTPPIYTTPCWKGADINHSGAISVQDIFDFLAAWFAGCA